MDIPFGLSSYDSIQPFSQFNVSNGVPNWWTAYNRLKHEYYDHLTEANLDNVLYALGGLLILNVLHTCSKEYLVNSGMFKTGSGIPSPGYMLELLKESKIGCPETLSTVIMGYYFKTSIFIFNLRLDSSF